MKEEIKYQAIWGKGYILLGILFGILFIIGGVLLSDYTIFFNIIAAIIVIYIGKSMLKQPYSKYDKNEIIVYGFLGSIRKHYRIQQGDEIEIKNDRLYLNKEKLKLNGWMIDKKDWNRLLEFYDGDAVFMNELSDD